MGTLRNALSAIETQLNGLGYLRSKLNFTIEGVPRSVAHRSYTFGPAQINPAYLPGNTADYAYFAPFQVDLLILWKAKGTHNSTGTFQEAYLDALDAFEALETELVKNQGQSLQENNLIAGAGLAPVIADEQEFLLLTLTLNIDVIRTM